MTIVAVRPSTAAGSLLAPPSKSFTHRALAAGHLARRTYRIDRPLDSDDTRATARAIARLGSPVTRRCDRWTIRHISPGPRPRPVTIDCGESGTTLRFLTALAALHHRPVTLAGSARLGARPMSGLLGSLEALGARVRRHGHALPIEVTGPIHAGSVRLDASQSSQFVSALLFVLPTLEGDSELVLEGRPVSRPYLEATVQVLRHHRVRLRRRGRRFWIPGGQEYRSSRFAVPGDASSAAYLWAAAAVTGGEVEVRGVPPAAVWSQADLAILSILRAQGAEVRGHGDRVRVRGRRLRPVSVDLTDAPDLYPLAGALAAVTPGRSVLRGAAHVAVKESDRKAGTVRLARALGAQVRVGPDRLFIEGTREPRPLMLHDLGDHRMVMGAAIGALAAHGRSTLGPAEAVGKSFPGFWEALATLTDGGGRT